MAMRIVSSSSTTRTLLRVSVMRPLAHWQSHRDARPSLGPIRRRHLAAMLFDDSLHDGEPETGPAAAAREERLEDAVDVAAEARTVVFDARLEPSPSRVVDERAADPHPPALRRMLPRVFDEVVEHLSHARA